jgi:hypothetical protein
MTGSLSIEPLQPERWDDLAGLFEEGGDPKWCSYHSDVRTQ